MSSQFDLPEGPVRDLVREYGFGVVGIARSSVESKLGNAYDNSAVDMRSVGFSHWSWGGNVGLNCELSVGGEARRTLGLDGRALVAVLGLGYASKYVGLVPRDGPEESKRGGGDLSFSRLRDRNDELFRTRWEEPVSKIWGRERTDCIAGKEIRVVPQQKNGTIM